MLFLTYFEMNEEMPVAERLQAAQKLTASGLFPPKDVKVVRWDITPDGWGILVVEADNAAALDRGLTLWRATGAGFFRKTRTAPAQPVLEAIPLTAEVLKALGGR
jgi:hypothetical protein